jgi:hypothetical protein
MEDDKIKEVYCQEPRLEQEQSPPSAYGYKIQFDWDGRVRRDLANLPYPRSRSSARESQAYSFGDRVPDKK